MSDPLGVTEIARGRLRNARGMFLVLFTVPAIGGFFLGLALTLSELDQALEDHVINVISLTVIFGAIGWGTAAIIAGIWLASPARVRYVVDGPDLKAMRGRRTVRSFNWTKVDEITLSGGTSTREMFVGLGSSSGVLGTLPNVWWTVKRPDGTPVDNRLPHVLIVGKNETDALWHVLNQELKGARLFRA